MAKREMPQTNKATTVAKKNVLPSDKVVAEEKPILLQVAKCNKLNLRAAPSLDSKVLCTLNLGTVVRVVGMENGWLHIDSFGDLEKKSPESKSGYILAQYTSVLDEGN